MPAADGGGPVPLVLSHPKSGRTWLRVIAHDLDLPLAFSHLNAGAKPRHLGLEHVDLTGIPAARTPAVLLVRDPRDVAVSSYHHVTKRSRIRPVRRLLMRWQGRTPPAGINDFVRHPGYGVAKVVQFNLAVAEALLARGNAYAYAYEAMRADPVAALRALAAFLGHGDLPAARIEAALEASSFEAMQAKERSGAYGSQFGGILKPRDASDIDSYKVRRGQVGGYRDELDAETIAHCDRLLAETGYFERMDGYLTRLGPDLTPA